MEGQDECQRKRSRDCAELLNGNDVRGSRSPQALTVPRRRIGGAITKSAISSGAIAIAVGDHECGPQKFRSR
jgi:hypothetical protein